MGCVLWGEDGEGFDANGASRIDTDAVPPLATDLDVRILTEEGEMLRHLTLDPTKNYQAIGNADVSSMS